ncbi:MAG: cytochrome P450 [Cyanobacteria bacterium P01_D01_bin.73]
MATTGFTPQLPLPVNEAPRLIRIWRWMFNPIGVLRNCRDRFGDIFQMNPYSVVLGHPDHISELFARDGRELSTPGSVNGVLRPILGDQSVLMLSGDRHRHRRKLLLPPFHGKALQSYGDAIQRVAQDMCDQWQPGQRLNARRLAEELTLRVIMETVFGLRAGDRYREMEPLMNEMVNMISTPAKSCFLFFKVLQKSWGPWGKFERSRDRLDQLLRQELAERREQLAARSDEGDSGDRQNNQRQDILSLLLATRDEDGNPLTDDELRDELMTLLFAGHETTASALAWVMYWLQAQPECLQKLREELDAMPEDAPPMAMAKLPYLTAVCNETLRIHPIAIVVFPRFVEKTFNLGGYEIREGLMMMGSVYLVHHHPDIYPEPDRFRPERFLERTFSATEFMPFGGGSRRCIGSALAMAELAIAVGTWVKQGNFKLQESGPLKPARRGVTMGPKGGVNVKFLGRR